MSNFESFFFLRPPTKWVEPASRGEKKRYLLPSKISKSKNLPTYLLMEDIRQTSWLDICSYYLQGFIHPRWLFGPLVHTPKNPSTSNSLWFEFFFIWGVSKWMPIGICSFRDMLGFSSPKPSQTNWCIYLHFPLNYPVVLGLDPSCVEGVELSQ